HSQHRAFRQDVELVVGHQRGDFNNAIILRAQPGHLEVDPDQIVFGKTHDSTSSIGDIVGTACAIMPCKCYCRHRRKSVEIYMSDLAQQHCAPCEGGTEPMQAEAVGNRMTELSDHWSQADGKIAGAFK